MPGINPDDQGILLADDSEHDAMLLQREFNRAGLGTPIHWVCGGKQTIDFLAGEGYYSDRSRFPVPSILIMDLTMPGMDGFDVLRWIRKRLDLKQLFIIVLSGVDDATKITLAQELGANAYLTKPASRPEVAAMVSFFKLYWQISCLPRA